MKTKIFTIFFLFYFFHSWASQIDSLETQLKNLTDTARISPLIELCEIYLNNFPDKALKCGNEANELLKSHKISDSRLLKILSLLGMVHRNMGDYPNAMNFYLEEIACAEKMKDREMLAFGYQSLSDIYNCQNDFDQAIENIEKSLDIFEQMHHLQGVAFCYYTLGQISMNKKDYPHALEYHRNALELRKKLNDKNGIASSMMQIGITLQKQDKHTQALLYLREAQVHFEKNNDKKNLIQIWNKLATSYMFLNDLTQAEEMAIQSLNLAELSGIREFSRECTWILTQIHVKQKDFEGAYEFQSLYIAYNDSIQHQETNLQFEKMRSSFEKDKMKIEMQQQLWIRNSFIVGFVLVVIFFIIVLRNNQERKRTNNLLRYQKEEIQSKNEELNIKNQNITASITYAKRIQEAMLPFEEKIAEFLPEFFIFFRPRDIVSGDFYWFQNKNEKIIVAVADCTGHGVPGAFMSMVGNELLNEIVLEKNISEPNLILSELHKGIRYVLKQDVTENRDGMDVVILIIDKKNRIVEYAGAMRPLFFIHDDIVDERKPDRKGIGGFQVSAEQNFEKHIIEIPSQTVFYMFSDGYHDQLGGEAKRKMTNKRFKELLVEIHKKPMYEQKKNLIEFLEHWMGNQKQIDDITIFGIRI